MNSAFIIAALKTLYPPSRYAVFPELRLGTGYNRGKGEVEQRIDLWVMGYWSSLSLERIAYEVKTSRADFKSELRQRLKRRPALLVSNRFYFATPVGLVKPEEVPPECGLVEITTEGKVQFVVLAPYRDAPPPAFTFLAAICRRAARAEEEAVLALARKPTLDENGAIGTLFALTEPRPTPTFSDDAPHKLGPEGDRP